MLLSACNPPGYPSKVDSQVEENKALVRRAFVEIENQGNLDVIDEIYDTDFVNHKPSSPETLSPADFKKAIRLMHIIYPDIKFKIENLIAEGDKVVVRWTNTWTFKGEMRGIPAATGVQGTSEGIFIYRIAGGKIIESWGISDVLGLFRQLGGSVPPIRQLGAVPPPGK